MFVVVDFLEESTVAMVDEMWIVDEEHMQWPSVGASRAQRLVREGRPPPANPKKHKVKVYRSVGMTILLTFPKHFPRCTWESGNLTSTPIVSP
ncbi:hypothetical protein FGIG_01119 [Fasciola gigantica]|uniref:Uncharacterized protein n=1 Tax=Fasciola gigantica TaxID=46835 RepID=A0A504YHZ7_FASGI|nr:hypothetical protein FGIG_01119 [Fasciola gigantica]